MIFRRLIEKRQEKTIKCELYEEKIVIVVRYIYDVLHTIADITP